MFARTIGLVTVALVLCAVGLQAGAGGTRIKDKDTPRDGKKEAPKKKFEGPPADSIAGMVKSVDLKTPSFTLTLQTGKDRKFLVDDKTEFWGPKGGDRGTGPAGLKDDCMEPGYEIKVSATKDGKAAKDVFLPNRKTETKEKKDKG